MSQVSLMELMNLIWNPEKDKKIAKKYSAKNLADKELNKKALADNFGLSTKKILL
jgi:starch synthase